MSLKGQSQREMLKPDLLNLLMAIMPCKLTPQSFYLSQLLAISIISGA